MVSLPKCGSSPFSPQPFSPCLKHYYDQQKGTAALLKEDAEVDWGAYDAIKTYTDPGFLKEGAMMDFIERMARARMLAFTDHCQETLDVFTVVKSYNDADRIVSRAVWDCRRINLRFRKPPWIPLGSPAALCCLEVTTEMLKTRRLVSYTGDAPDWYYLIVQPSWLLPYFVFRGLEALEVWEELRRRGVDMPGPRITRSSSHCRCWPWDSRGRRS